MFSSEALISTPIYSEEKHNLRITLQNDQHENGSLIAKRFTYSAPPATQELLQPAFLNKKAEPTISPEQQISPQQSTLTSLTAASDGQENNRTKQNLNAKLKIDAKETSVFRTNPLEKQETEHVQPAAAQNHTTTASILVSKLSSPQKKQTGVQKQASNISFNEELAQQIEKRKLKKSKASPSEATPAAARPTPPATPKASNTLTASSTLNPPGEFSLVNVMKDSFKKVEKFIKKDDKWDDDSEHDSSVEFEKEYNSKFELTLNSAVRIEQNPSQLVQREIPPMVAQSGTLQPPPPPPPLPQFANKPSTNK